MDRGSRAPNWLSAVYLTKKGELLLSDYYIFDRNFLTLHVLIILSVDHNLLMFGLPRLHRRRLSKESMNRRGNLIVCDASTLLLTLKLCTCVKCMTN